MSIGAVSGSGGALSAMLRRAADRPKQTEPATDGGGSREKPVIAALRKQLQEAQEQLARHVKAGADERTIAADEAKIRMISTALASALQEQAEAEKAAARSGSLYL